MSNGQQVLAHVTSHILHDPTIVKSEELCGLCLWPLATCAIYLTRQAGWTCPWSIKYGSTTPCPNTINFSYSAAMVSSNSSLCLNIPIQCPFCPDGSPAVWWYNMWHHFQNCHQGIDTAKHKDLWKITLEEVKAMKQVWRNHRKQPKQHGKGKQKVPLEVSEAHSSCRLPRCYNKDLHDWFLFISMCTNTGVIATHAFIFLPASGPIVLVDSHAAHYCDSELRLIVHCDLLLQWHYCSRDTYCLCYSIVLVEYLVRLAG